MKLWAASTYAQTSASPRAACLPIEITEAFDRVSLNLRGTIMACKRH